MQFPLNFTLKSKSHLCYTLDFKIVTWLTEHGLPTNIPHLTELLADKLLEDLGIAEYLQEPTCNIAAYHTNNHGWESGNNYLGWYSLRKRMMFSKNMKNLCFMLHFLH